MTAPGAQPAASQKGLLLGALLALLVAAAATFVFLSSRGSDLSQKSYVTPTARCASSW